tara:strand:+ start:18567 stop:19961 length:1395 start_codon:yes stop_codon:yes gene_type:complete
MEVREVFSIAPTHARVAPLVALALVTAGAVACGRIGFDGSSPQDLVDADRSTTDADTLDASGYETGFDTFDDWTISGDPMWECGEQTDDAFGPATGTSDNSVCGTGINKNYNATNAVGFLTSPSLSLSGLARPQFSFWMDLEAELNTCGGDFTCDGAYIALSVNGSEFFPVRFGDQGLRGLLPNAIAIGPGGNPGWAESQPAGDWAEVTLDLLTLDTTGLDTIGADDTLQFRFAFVADSSVGDLPGWYIDDVRLFDAPIVTPRSVPYLEDFESPDGWVTSGGGDIWEIGTLLKGSPGPENAISGSSLAATGVNRSYELSPNGPRDTQSFLTSPPISLAATSAPHLTFWMDLDTQLNEDGGHIALSVNGAPFAPIVAGDAGLTGFNYTNDGSLAATNWPATDGWTGLVPAADWVRIDVSLFELTSPGLGAIAAGDSIEIRFGFLAGRNSSLRSGWYIDDVEVADL